jgi:mRNA interferase HigB
MHVISVKMLREYWDMKPENAFARGPLAAWHKMVVHARWKKPGDLKATFGNASIRPSGRVVFNCAGNKLRIVAGVNYAAGVVYVKFVGSHAEYDAIDVDTVDNSR